MFAMSIKSDLNKATRALDKLARQQVPFATARALTATAKLTAQAESDNIDHLMPRATKFTKRSVGSKPATKASQTATVYMRDIAAGYLEPFEFGGKHKLPGRALLNPKDIKLNVNGQLSRGTLAKLKARPDVFIGPVRMKNGEVVNGVWQRPVDKQQVSLIDGKGRKLRGLNQFNSRKGATGHLKLLIRFGDALPVTKQLGWGKVAKLMVNRTFGAEFDKALRDALRTAR